MPFSNISQQLLFPDLLHNLLEDCDRNDESNIISWSPKGNSFKVHNKEVFTQRILPRYFRQSKYKSFVRQLNIWGFFCETKGSDKGHYFHRQFLRGQREISCMMKRGTKKRTAQLTLCLSNASEFTRLLAPFESTFLDTGTGTMTKPTLSISSPDFEADEDFASLIDVVDDEDYRQPQQSSFPMPVLTVPPSSKKDSTKMISMQLSVEPAQYRSQKCPQTCSVSQEKRGAKFQVNLPFHDADKVSGAATFSINEPLEDWLSCLEKLFDAKWHHHTKQGGHCDRFQLKTKNHRQTCSETAWSSWDFFEPRPLRMNSEC